VKEVGSCTAPTVTYPWDDDVLVKDVSDSIQLAQPAFSAATLHQHLPKTQTLEQRKQPGYDVGVVETPSMLNAQGVELGSVGLAYFLELPTSDHLVTDVQQSSASNAEAQRNKELLQSSPEQIGIRKVKMKLVYDRLIELGDLDEAFRESPDGMSILNHQSPGDLYLHLFAKFLLPPRFDSSTEDPNGIKTQIDTLIRILQLKGVWYDFSLVEWRIRVGQILWNDSDAESQSHQLFTDRDLLLLQITLAGELLLRLDAVSSMDPDEAERRIQVTPEEYRGFLELKSRKIDWDLVLARRFLDNILVVKEDGQEADTAPPTAKPNGLLSMLSLGTSKTDVDETPASEDIILLPRHQAQQLSGLLHFAEALKWPEIDVVVTELAQKLGIPQNVDEGEHQSPTYGGFLNPKTPSVISIYGTPLATPRSTNTIRDNYFGHLSKPVLKRTNTSQTLTVPLTTTLLANAAEGAAGTLNIGGWLSRSYLTGLILPGEAISHFLISTLLENDNLAIAALGDSAKLYGGFVYANKSWWSKASVIGRVLGSLEDSVECMGWICVSTLPSLPSSGWYELDAEQIEHPR